MVSKKQIQKICRDIAKEFKPLRIILFGSYGSGNANPDSDVDLLVVMPDGEDVIQKSVEIRLKIQSTFPLDIIVRSPKKMKQRLALGDSFLRDILERGKVLYEAHHA